MEKRLQKLNQALDGLQLGQPLLYFDTVGSTNDALKEKAARGAKEGFTVFAGGQTRGRGRRGKTWLSPEGKGVYMSVLLRPGWPASEASLISMLGAVAVARSLEALGVREIRLKWPNDVLAGGRKIAGILVEPRISRQGMDFAVIGIGLNVHQKKEELDLVSGGAATSCRLEGVRAECDQVLIRVLHELDACYALARRNQKEQILEAWARRRIGMNLQ